MCDIQSASNPYVGPRPFRFGEELFGRDKEVPDLFYLLNAERIVLLHSPSGAGKSSLVQAGLLPRVKQEQFDVWPTIRVGMEPVMNGGTNRYLLSTILSLEEELPETRRRSPAELSKLNLEQYVTGRPRKRAASSSILLVFDQFEEILTADPLAIDTKREFFGQLGELLLNRDVWALFAIREDYLAPLDPYAPLVPTQLTNRFRIDLLSREAAVLAIKQPAHAAGREFSPGAAEQLVDDLAAMSVQQPDGSFVKQSGHTVEPVQLQVVCRRLWDEMPAAERIIHPQAERFGDVNQALAAYYDLSIARVAGDKSRERCIREWFGDKLITRGDIRGQVLQGAEKTEGLDNQLINQILDTHLIRAEKRRGATWYELAHDRLIAPVSRSNNAWFEAQLEEFQRRAAAWEKPGHPEGLLLGTKDLWAAEAWIYRHGDVVTDMEARFLKASRGKQARGLVLLLLSLIVIGFAVFAFVEWRKAQSTVAALQQAIVDEEKKDAAKKDAEDKAAAALKEKNGAEVERALAVLAVQEQRKARDSVFLDLLTKVIRYPITVGGGSVPGEVKALDGNWITLVAAKDQDKTAFVIAKSFADNGEGRVVIAGHDFFLVYSDQNRDNQVLGTVLLWLRGDKPARVLIRNGRIVSLPQPALLSLERKIRNWHFEVEQVDDLSDQARLNTAGVLIVGNDWKGFDSNEMNAIGRFVKGGGGVLGVGLGWSWSQPRPDSPKRPMDLYPMNQLFGRFGAAWTDKEIRE